MSGRTLLLLTCWVLALHMLAFWAWPGVPVRPSAEVARVFNTRSITPQVAVPPPPEVAARALAPRPPAGHQGVRRRVPPRPVEHRTVAEQVQVPESRIELDIPELDASASTVGDASQAWAHAGAPEAGVPEPHRSDALTTEPQAEQHAATIDPPPASAPLKTTETLPTPAETEPLEGDPGLRISTGAAGAASDARATPPPLAIPPPTRLEYAVGGQYKGFQYSASAQLVWQHDGVQYQARQEVRAFLIGSRTQTSVGTLGPWGVHPRRFGDRTRSEQAAHFDFEAGRITFSANTPSAPIAAGAQDRLSVFVELAALVAGAPQQYPEGTQIALTTASARAVSRWVFRVGKTQMLELPAGPMLAVKLERVLQDVYEQGADLWLAPSLHYLPVRLLMTQSNGSFVDLQLKESGVP